MTATDFNLMLAQHNERHLKPFALSLTGDGADAQDLCQDTMLRALQYRDKFQFGTNLKAWLFTMMRNIFINKYRRQKRMATTELPAGESGTYQPQSLTTQNGAFAHMRMMEIGGAMERLPRTFRLAFELYYTGYKYQEIADLVQEPLGTIKSRIHFARKALVAQLER